MKGTGRLAGSIVLLLTLTVWGRAQSAALEWVNDARTEHVGVMARQGWSLPEIAPVAGLRGVLRPSPLAIDSGSGAIAVWEEELPTGSAGVQKAVRAARPSRYRRLAAGAHTLAGVPSGCGRGCERRSDRSLGNPLQIRQ